MSEAREDDRFRVYKEGGGESKEGRERGGEQRREREGGEGRGRQVNRQIERQMDRQTNRQTDQPTDRQTDKHKKRVGSCSAKIFVKFHSTTFHWTPPGQRE